MVHPSNYIPSLYQRISICACIYVSNICIYTLSGNLPICYGKSPCSNQFGKSSNVLLCAMGAIFWKIPSGKSNIAIENPRTKILQLRTQTMIMIYTSHSILHKFPITSCSSNLYPKDISSPLRKVYPLLFRLVPQSPSSGAPLQSLNFVSQT